MTSSSNQTLERIARRVPVPEPAYDRLLRRRDRKQRNRRLSAGALAFILALVSLAALTRAFRGSERPADEPTPKPLGIFSGIGGWITYGDRDGIWAVDPSHSGDRERRVKLSSTEGTPVDWSSDGSKLLIAQTGDWLPIPGSRASRMSDDRLIVLNADGTETLLATSKNYVLGGGWSSPGIGGSFSPDGSHVIYASKSSIYVIDAQGGTPRLLQTAASSRWFSVNGRRVHAMAYNPTYSPNWTQIAYFDGAGSGSGDIVHQLWVMNADGSGTRVLVDDVEGDRIYNLAWSPDGTRLAFGLGSKGIYIVDVTVPRPLTLAIPDGGHPYWSPDGTRIAFANLDPNNTDPPPGPCADPNCRVLLGTLEIAPLDGTDVHVQWDHVQEFGYGEPGPWNPLVQPDPEVTEAAVARESPTVTWALSLAAASLVLVAGITLVRHRRGAERRERDRSRKKAT
jgi:WD40 repeat protein